MGRLALYRGRPPSAFNSKTSCFAPTPRSSPWWWWRSWPFCSSSRAQPTAIWSAFTSRKCWQATCRNCSPCSTAWTRSLPRSPPTRSCSTSSSPCRTIEAPENYFRAHLMDSIRAGSLLATINSTDRRALRISVFNEHGDYISAGSLYETDEEIAATLGSSDAFAQMERQLGAGGGVVVSGPHADYWSDNESVRLFSLIRPLSTSYSSKVYGYISVQQSADVLHSLSLWDSGRRRFLRAARRVGRGRFARGWARPARSGACRSARARGERGIRAGHGRRHERVRHARPVLRLDAGAAFAREPAGRALPAGLPADPAGGACVAGHPAGGGLPAGRQDLAPAARIFRGHRAHQSGQPRQRHTPAFQLLHGGIAGPGPHLPRHAAQAQPVHRL